MNSTLVAVGFSAYLLFVVISYMLLSNPDIDLLWGGFLLAFSLLAVAIPVYYVIDEFRYIFIEFISRNVLAIAAFFFFAWLFLYAFLKQLRPSEGLFSSSWVEEVVYIAASAYGAFFGVYFLLANMLLCVAFATILLHFLVCIKVLKLAMHARKAGRS